jgi:hypothetical protein
MKKRKKAEFSEKQESQKIGKFYSEEGEVQVRCRCAKIYTKAPLGNGNCPCGFMVYKFFV